MQLHGQMTEIEVLLDFPGEATKANFSERAGRIPENTRLSLDIKTLCIAEMVRRYMDLNKQEIYALGEIMPEDTDDSEIEKLHQTLRSHSGGCIVEHSNFSILIFPASQQSWDFLRLPKAAAGISLQFIVIPPLEALPELGDTPAVDNSAGLQQKQSSLVALDHDRLFHANSRDRNVFLLFHPDYSEQIATLTTSLHKAGATVYLNNEPGSWQYFITKCDSGTIIVSCIFVSQKYQTLTQPNRCIPHLQTST